MGINDILMGMIGTIGNIALVRDKDEFAIKNVALIKNNNNLNQIYLYNLLQSDEIGKQIISGMDGGTQKFISLRNIRNLKINIPLIDEQCRVGSFLETFELTITLHQ